MTSFNPWFPAAEDVQQRDQDRRTGTIERRAQFVQVTIPFAVIGGTPRDHGYHSYDTTTYQDMVRSDAYLTAPILHYDLQTWDAWGSGLTSIDWEIRIFITTALTGAGGTVIASGSSTGGNEQFTDQVDLFDTISPDVYTRYASIRLRVKRTGGSGGAAVRMTKPWILWIKY